MDGKGTRDPFQGARFPRSNIPSQITNIPSQITILILLLTLLPILVPIFLFDWATSLVALFFDWDMTMGALLVRSGPPTDFHVSTTAEKVGVTNPNSYLDSYPDPDPELTLN